MSQEDAGGAPWTVQRIVSWMSEDFARRGVDSPRLDAEVLVGHVLGLPRLQLFLDLERPLSDEELEAIRALVQRRRRREPVAYLVGRRAFYKHDFRVSDAVLIPRPDTETLVEAALAVLRGLGDAQPRERRGVESNAPLEPVLVPAEGLPAEVGGEPLGESRVELDEVARADLVGESRLEPILEEEAPTSAETPPATALGESARTPRVASPAAALRALDICTGSGCVGISLAAELPTLAITLSDVSPAALAVARENATTILGEGRATLIESDLFAGLRGQHFEVITANPPYITSDEMRGLAPDIREHEPHLALEAGADGFAVHWRIVREAGELLVPGGAVLVEVGAGQAPRLAEGFRRAGYVDIQIHRDYGGIERVVEAHRTF